MPPDITPGKAEEEQLNMKPGFMTSVCPSLSMAELVDTARRYGYEGIEFRTEWDHAHGLELDSTKEKRKECRSMLADGGLEASCVATSVRFNTEDKSERDKQQDTLKAYIELAADIGAPCIRTFGDPVPEPPHDEHQGLTERILACEAESYAAVDGFADQHGVTVLIETHTNMLGQYCATVLERAGAQNLGVLWHIGHHLKRGQSVDEAWSFIEGHVKHLHFRADDERYDMDNRRTFELLKAEGFKGYFSLEVIDPDDSEAVLGLHVRKFREFLDSVS